MHRAAVLAILTVTPLLPTTPLCAQTAQSPADGALFYETTIRPLLERNCLGCHGDDPEKLRGGLDLRTRRGLLAGGEYGPAIDAGEPADSLLLRAIGYDDDLLQMPPAGKLPQADREALAAWIALGAPFGGDDDALVEVESDDTFALTDDDRAWWSIQPLVRPAVPVVAGMEAAHPIDRFIAAGLVDAGLTPAPPVGPRAWLRRATYDLTGLPPTRADVEAFLADSAPDARQRAVARLLASPQYGVKWGRHWLDLVRFAETDSYERDRLKPGAWRYRDWVIDAFNADMPYDEFLITQLAGDEKTEHPTADDIVATGYLRLGIWDDEPTDTALAQYDDLDSILDTTCRVMLGVSMGCARCHDHKGDPIPQTDYYRMLAFFRGVAPYKVGGGNATTPDNYTELIPADLGAPDADSALARWRAERTALETALLEHVGAARVQAGPAAVAAAEAKRDSGLVVHFPFDDAAPDRAASAVTGPDGVVTDVEIGAPGRFGRAFAFDGGNDGVRIERPVQDDFTLSVWFNTTHVAPGGADLRWFRGAGLIDGEVPGIVNDFGLSLVGTGHVTAGAGNPETFLSSGGGYHDGNWHHAVLTRERDAGRLRLYVDGDLVDEQIGPRQSLDAPGFLDIGRMQPGYGSFRGRLDDVRIYARALAPDEVLDLTLDGGTSDAYAALVAEHSADPDAYTALRERRLGLQRPRRDVIEVLRVKEVGRTAPPTHVLIRGNPHAPAGVVEPGFPLILGGADAVIAERPESATTTGRRLALARWIAREDNLRTARVMVNRIWQHHFGRGLVRTPNDFGFFGLPPTHPELLDWLAVEFIEGGWSVKAMHERIMSSAAYARSGQANADALARDPENDRLWRFDLRRLGAEEIRDSILDASGTLNLALGGPGIYPKMPDEVLATASRPGEAWGRSSPEDAARRSVYIHVKRSLLYPFLEALDLADTDASCPVRFATTQPTQALTMLNSDFMQEQAALLAARAAADGGSQGEIVGRALTFTLRRDATPDEVAAGVRLIEDLEREEGFDPDRALAAYCLVLLNLNEFVYID